MADTVTINSIHLDTKQVDITVNINGTDYAKVLPLLTLNDANTLTAQLQAEAQEVRSEFAALTAVVQAADANAPVTVDPSVQALVGTAIPVDVTSTTSTDGTTGSDTSAQANPDTTGSTASDATDQAQSTDSTQDSTPNVDPAGTTAPADAENAQTDTSTTA